jgi:hypothetical protein
MIEIQRSSEEFQARKTLAKETQKDLEKITINPAITKSKEATQYMQKHNIMISPDGKFKKEGKDIFETLDPMEKYSLLKATFISVYIYKPSENTEQLCIVYGDKTNPKRNVLLYNAESNGYMNVSDGVIISVKGESQNLKTVIFNQIETQK